MLNSPDITDVSSLKQVLSYIKGVKDKSKLMVFLDFDDTIYSPDYNRILEPRAAKELFKYMIDNDIFFSIITGRFQDTVCHDDMRDLSEMEDNVVYGIHPFLKSLGLNVKWCQTSEFRKNIYKIRDERGNMVGALYMGIYFSGNKGQTVKHYLRQFNVKDKHVIFVDDYEPYLSEFTTSLPEAKAFRINVRG